MSENSDTTIGLGSSDRSQSGSMSARRVDPLLGTVFADRYRILEVLGRGGMGVVYKARHELMDRLVAIKMMLPQLVSDDVSLARFQREARAASKINHPNIIAIHDFGLTNDNGVAYLVMDYIEGHTLATAIEKDGQLGVTRATRIFLQVCDALQHAHKLGVVHRDLKPGNIMLVCHDDNEDFVKVVDFGVAKLTEGDSDQRLTGTGEIFGSPVYMSPEQCSGDPLDARSDIYALGCVLYETLTGKPPCVGRTPIETITKHISVVPPTFSEARPDLYIPEWIERVVFKALSKDASKRQQSMQEFFDELYSGAKATSTATQLKALSNSVRTGAVAAHEAAKASAPQKNAISKSLIVAVALVAFVTVAAGAVILMKPNKPAVPHAKKPAKQAIDKPLAKTPDEPVQKAVQKPQQQTIADPDPPKQAAVKPVAKPVRKPIAAPSDAIEAVPVRPRRSRSYYDYTDRHESGNSGPIDLPIKEYGTQ